MNKLKAARLAHGLSQSQLREKLGITVRTYRRWEDGEGNPSPDNKAQELFK